MTSTPAAPQIRKRRLAAIASAAGLVVILTVTAFFLLRHGSEAEIRAEEENAAKAKALDDAYPSDLLPGGSLKEQFRTMSAFGDDDRQKVEHEIKGKIVEWKLTVFEASKTGLVYSIQTSDQDKVETLLTVIPSNHDAEARLEALRAGDTIKVRGIIKGIALGRVEIDPAILER